MRTLANTNKEPHQDFSSTPIVFMFSGQGSQYYQMGRDLYDKEIGFRDWLHNLDGLVKSYMGESVLSQLYNEKLKKSDIFDEITFTHPAIFMVQYALAQTLIDKGIRPDAVLGASLGEFVAAAIADIITLEDAVKIILKQAELFERHCSDGGMLAILENTLLYKNDAVLNSNSEIAAINHDNHFVVSGQMDDLDITEAHLKARRITCQRLPLKQAFHSSYLDVIEERIKHQFRGVTTKPPKIPFISCTKATSLKDIQEHYFWEAIRQPIQLAKTIKATREERDFFYLDLGPGGTLSNVVKYFEEKTSRSSTLNVLSPFGDTKGWNKVNTIFKNNRYKISVADKQERKMKVYVFPGQGSQIKGMGRELFDEFPEITQKADQILGYSIKTLCLEDPNRELAKTQFTQPALYTVNALTYLKKIQNDCSMPVYMAGHSLGEYNALFAAGVFNFEDGLRLVKKRGELMSLAPSGSMAAVIGCDIDTIKLVLAENSLDSIDIANLNLPTQVVLAGPTDDIYKAKIFFEKVKATYIPLNVSAPFHSRYMKSIMEEFSLFLQKFDFNPLKIPVIANINAEPYVQTQIASNLTLHLCSPVKWFDSIRYLIGKGHFNYEEVGPGNVLSKLITDIIKNAQPINSNNTISELKSIGADRRNSIGVTSDIDREHVNETIKSDANLPQVQARNLGSEEFKADYNIKYAYISGSMYKGIASKELVARMGTSGLLGFFGTGGVPLAEVESTIVYLQGQLSNVQPFGMNLLHQPSKPGNEMALVDLFLKHNVRYVEASAFMQVTPAIVKYRLKGLSENSSGQVEIKNKLMAKISRPELAELFLKPAPVRILNQLLEENLITRQEYDLATRIPLADDLCAESDSGGHTDGAVSSVLVPTIIRIRDNICQEQGYAKKVRVGAAGGIGTPEAAAAAFILGADFIMTGSINQCTVEAGTSNQVKEMLQLIDIQDTEYAPAGDMFELGAKVQVMRRGIFFPARANNLYNLWRHYNSIDEIDAQTRKTLEEKYFGRSIEAVYGETKDFFLKTNPAEIEKAENNPKHKMALIFKWYFVHSARLAMSGDSDDKVNFQVHTGPAMGAFNKWVKGTELEHWYNRHADHIGLKIMEGAADILNNSFRKLHESRFQIHLSEPIKRQKVSFYG